MHFQPSKNCAVKIYTAGGRSREPFRPKTPWRPPFGSTYNKNYVSYLAVNCLDVWRHVGLSDAKNSDVKGIESKKLFKFYCFFGVLVFPSFFFFLPGFSKITFRILDEFCFCFFFFFFILPIPIIVPSLTLISEIFQELFQLKDRFYTPFLG